MTEENAVEAAREVFRAELWSVHKDLQPRELSIAMTAFSQGWLRADERRKIGGSPKAWQAFDRGEAYGRADERSKAQPESALRAAARAADRDASVAHDAIWHKSVAPAEVLHDADRPDSANAAIWRIHAALRAALDAAPREPSVEEVERARIMASVPEGGSDDE